MTKEWNQREMEREACGYKMKRGYLSKLKTYQNNNTYQCHNKGWWTKKGCGEWYMDERKMDETKVSNDIHQINCHAKYLDFVFSKILSKKALFLEVPYYPFNTTPWTLRSYNKSLGLPKNTKDATTKWSLPSMTSQRSGLSLLKSCVSKTTMDVFLIADSPVCFWAGCPELSTKPDANFPTMTLREVKGHMSCLEKQSHLWQPVGFFSKAPRLWLESSPPFRRWSASLRAFVLGASTTHAFWKKASVMWVIEDLPSFLYSISVSPHIIHKQLAELDLLHQDFFSDAMIWLVQFLLPAFWARNFLKSPRRKCPALMVKLLRPMDFHHLSRCNSYIIALGVPTSAAGSHAMWRIKALSPCHVHIIATWHSDSHTRTWRTTILDAASVHLLG